MCRLLACVSRIAAVQTVSMVTPAQVLLHHVLTHDYTIVTVYWLVGPSLLSATVNVSVCVFVCCRQWQAGSTWHVSHGSCHV